MQAPTTTRAFANRYGVTIDAEYADENPNLDRDPGEREWEATHWRVTLRMQGRQLTTYFSQGLAHTGPPDAATVLDSLASDAGGYDSARGFEDWAADYGYDTDSRRAERTYRTVARQTAKLRRFAGPLYDALMAAERL